MKKYKKLMLSFILCLIFIPTVNAKVTIESRDKIKIDGNTVYKVYDNLAENKTNIIETTGAIIKLNVDGEYYDGYCIDFGVTVSAGLEATSYNLQEYYSKVLGEAEAKELVKKITLYAKLGYGNEGKKTEKYYLATQQLIWETINDTGFYQSDYYKTRANEKFNITNLGWTTDKKNRIDISKEIKEVKAAVNNYYLIPSLCSSQHNLEIELGKDAVYTDTNKVLSQYEVSCSEGLECVKTENQLKVLATKEAGHRTITFTKKTSGTQNLIYRAKEEQGIITNTGILEPVTCSFGIDSIKNVQTSDSNIIYIIIVGLFCGISSYIIYRIKRSSK